MPRAPLPLDGGRELDNCGRICCPCDQERRRFEAVLEVKLGVISVTLGALALLLPLLPC